VRRAAASSHLVRVHPRRGGQAGERVGFDHTVRRGLTLRDDVLLGWA